MTEEEKEEVVRRFYPGMAPPFSSDVIFLT
jgi:hypothetical protein